ncbi:hypothetical protein FA13DRAFT_1744851 [Coprinellus micaceus]|uniref:Uncharacterized protein n=1 Tax=Coprinellus micaceus TaxID=71717 RepID=A0A4Y7SBG1_COPMI|nr:hypothetical protein FA13DRAFT_1744851 [Coprinellus micaceus]
MRTPTGLLVQGSKGGVLMVASRNHSTSTLSLMPLFGMGSRTGATAGIRRSQENIKETQFPAFRDRAGTKRPNTGPDQSWFRTC